MLLHVQFLDISVFSFFRWLFEICLGFRRILFTCAPIHGSCWGKSSHFCCACVRVHVSHHCSSIHFLTKCDASFTAVCVCRWGGATLARSTSHVNIALRCFLPGKAQWQENMSIVDKKSIQNNALPFWNTALSQLKQKRLRWWRGTFSRVFHFRISMVNSGEQETTVYGKGSCIFSCESRNDASFLL